MTRALLFLVFLFFAASQPALAGKRIALVVGNDSYRSIAPLRNARADARAVARALEASGFGVTMKFDLGERELLAALRHFKTRVEGGDDVVFYFSGHGVQLGAANYLLPVDIAGESEDQVRDEALHLQRVLDDMQEQKARFTLAIVDACRNNPFKGKGRSIGGRGLAPINPATGQMVLYSAGAGQEALDRLDDQDRDPNGVFTRILLKEMNRPGLPVDRVMRNVRDEVVRLARKVQHDQVPALYDQTIGDFYFQAGAGAVQAPPPADPADPETALWSAVAAGDAVHDYEAYLQQYPQGRYTRQAQEAVIRLRTGMTQAQAARERSAWEEVARLNTAAAYQSYLAQWPQGTYAVLAKARAAALAPAALDGGGPRVRITDAGKIFSTYTFTDKTIVFNRPGRFQAESVIELAHEKNWPAGVATFEKRYKKGAEHLLYGLEGYEIGSVEQSKLVYLPRSLNAQARFDMDKDFFVVIESGGLIRLDGQ